MMRFPVLFLVMAAALPAADEAQSALMWRAQSDFERVELSTVPRLVDAKACVQSQAAVLPVSLPEQKSLIGYRKGYCALTAALITGERRGFEEAARTFERAVADWPQPSGKDKVAEPVSSGLRMLAAVARLQAGASPEEMDRLRPEMAAAAEHEVCAVGIMPRRACHAFVDNGRLWLGWMAFQARRLDDAGRYFERFPESGWRAWLAGRRFFERGYYPLAAKAYRQAVDIWASDQRNPAPPLEKRLEPKFDTASAFAQLGEAQLLAGDLAAAMASFDSSLKAQAANPRVLYLRARAKELSGLKEPALADLNLASRSAFAEAAETPEGEAHLYRGIWHFRRSEFTRAEDEFSNALNVEMPDKLRPDAVAWRSMAAVAAGTCAASRETLENTLPSVSPVFPKDEAGALIEGCRAQSKVTRPPQ
jgi:tetratricopeptide (TPR) repeat protein